MLKVLYLRSSFDPGGTESLLLSLFNYPQSKIQFHYALLKQGGLIPELKSYQNVYYTIFREKKFDLFVIRKLWIILKENNITAVHTHQLIELIYAVILKAFKPDLRLFHTIHGYHDKKAQWAENIERFLIRLTHKTFTVSEASLNILKGKGYPVNKMEVLYNAVSPPVSANGALLSRLKKTISYKNGDFIIGMIGNFVWWKDQMTIIKAFNSVKEGMPGLKVVFMGEESSWSEKCKKQLNASDINNRVYFLGSVKDAATYLSIFDLFIMSTLMDTFGIVVIEALLQKIPVIASDIEVMKELSHNGKYFDLFKKQDPASLAQAIIKHFQRKNDEKVKEAYEYARNAFSYDKYCDTLVKYYKYE